MPLAGHVYYVTDALVAFGPVVSGDQAPTAGFVPWSSGTVTATYYWDAIGFIPMWSTTAALAPDGSFQLADPPSGEIGDLVSYVSLRVTSAVPVFRTGYIPLANARSQDLDMWIYVDRLTESDGISAGTVSSQVSGEGLPGNTVITSGGSSYGLNFAGSDGQVDINFNIAVTPDTSPDLSEYFDLSIIGYDISVGWPTSWIESADDVLNKITSGIAASGNNVNLAVLKKMELMLETQDFLTSTEAAAFLKNEVSVTFYGVGYAPVPHSWGIGDTSDQTIALTATPCIGFPRNFYSDPI